MVIEQVRVAPRRREGGRRMRVTIARGAIYVVMAIFSATVVFPLVVMLLGSFKTQFQFYSNPWGLPSAFNLDNYVYAWQQAQIPRFIVNSVIVATGTVGLT